MERYTSTVEKHQHCGGVSAFGEEIKQASDAHKQGAWQNEVRDSQSAKDGCIGDKVGRQQEG